MLRSCLRIIGFSLVVALSSSIPSLPDASAAQTSSPSGSVTAKGRDVLLDLGTSHGLWAFSSSRNAWNYLHKQSIKSAVRADVNRNNLADTVIDFGSSLGIYALLDNGNWQQIHNLTAKWIIAADFDGSGRDDLIVDFGDPYGIFMLKDSTTWVQLHANTAKSAVVADMDHNGRPDAVIDFGDQMGIWVYQNNNTWVGLHSVSARWILRADLDRNKQDDLVIDFGPAYGIWIRYNNTTWAPLHGVSAKSAIASDLTRSGYLDTLLVDFDTQYGIWKYSKYLKPSEWVQLHGLSAKGLLSIDTDANLQDDVIFDFGSQYGIWKMTNNASWVQMYGISSASMAGVTLPSKNLNEFPGASTDSTRFLTQATFGPTDGDTTRVSQIGYRAWIEEQFTKPRSYHGTFWDSENARLKAASGGDQTANGDQVTGSFWKQALTGGDPLRQRVAFALSEIFVISMADGSIDYYDDRTRGVAAYLDMLGDGAFGNYRMLLEAVALQPMMGRYLSHLGNEKEDPESGRLPDENFAREVMQLFSIGLVQLNLDGTPKLEGGLPIPTYTPADVAGLAKVFTGFGWYSTTLNDEYWYGWKSNAARNYRPMVAYPQYHSTSEKAFLGVMIPAQVEPDPLTSLRVALDTLYYHPNVGPFIGKQLIQRLVTSNPSPAYVERVASAFNNNGAGVRGDMKAVIRAILLDPEARNSTITASYGKLREPILRISAFMRALNAKSTTGRFPVGRTDDPSYSLAQSPMYSPSVFNFYRPGYLPPNSASGDAGMVVPELQIANEVSMAGYANFVAYALSNGLPLWGTSKGDIKPDYAPLMALATTPSELAERINAKLLNGQMSDTLKAAIANGVLTITVPDATATNKAAVDEAKLNRVRFALLLALTSSEFIVQK